MAGKRGRAGGAWAGVRGRAGRGDEDGEDEFFDRTKRARPAAATPASGCPCGMSAGDLARGAAEFQLSEALRLERRLRGRLARLEAEEAAGRETAAAGGSGEDVDGLDAVLAQEQLADMRKALKGVRSSLGRQSAEVARLEGELIEMDPSGLALADFRAREAARRSDGDRAPKQETGENDRGKRPEDTAAATAPGNKPPPDAGAVQEKEESMPPPAPPRREKPLGPCAPPEKLTEELPDVPRGGLEVRGRKKGASPTGDDSKEALVAAARERFEETMRLRERVAVAGGGGLEALPSDAWGAADDGADDDGWVPPAGHTEYRL